jgi:hypothetical protein
LIDKDGEIIYNQRRYRKRKMEARGDLAAIKLTTRIADSQKVEFPKNLFGLPFQLSRLAPTGNKKAGDQKHERRWSYRYSV